jgi:hypothetical protein
VDAVTVLLLAIACKHAPPPTLYPVALPAMTAPERFEAAREGDECPGPASLIPGTVPPYVQLTEAGLPVASCRGLVVDDAEHAELLADVEVGRYWRDTALACSAGREADRVYGQGVYDTAWNSWGETELEVRRLRAAVPLIAIGGTVAGAGLTLAILKAVELSVRPEPELIQE